MGKSVRNITKHQELLNVFYIVIIFVLYKNIWNLTNFKAK